jgi:hypothetical protein
MGPRPRWLIAVLAAAAGFAVGGFTRRGDPGRTGRLPSALGIARTRNGGLSPSFY